LPIIPNDLKIDMPSFFLLLTHEVRKLAKAYQLLSHLFWTLLASSISLPLIVSHEQVATLGPLFFLAGSSTSILALSNIFFKRDQESGDLDFALLRFGAFNIALAKFSAISLFIIMSLALCLPFFAIFYNLSFNTCAMLFLCSVCLTLQSASLALLLAAISCYFARQSLAFHSVVLPFTIPMLIFCGMFIELSNFDLGFILLGILFVTVATSLLLTAVLLENIS
jgi:ABC-type transport system involved in cytochrome c biogenesis permease component